MILATYWRAFGAIALLLLLSAGIGGLLALVDYVWSAAAAWLLLVVAVLSWGAVDYYLMSPAFDEDDEVITHVTTDGDEP